MEYKIFTINPGSTSTKIALFEGKEKIFSQNVQHDSNELERFEKISDQLVYRKEKIDSILKENDIKLEDVDAFVGRGGGLISMDGGTYIIDDLVLDHCSRGANGVMHPAMLGPQLANIYANKNGVNAYVVNPPDVDELSDLARITGIKGIYRTVHLHALNLKETAIRHSIAYGKKYDEANYIVCHIGGGISISAHEKGKMVDGFDIVGGEGPMAPTRCGFLSISDIIRYLEDNELKDLESLCTKNGGFISHLGTSDAIEVKNMANNGDKYADLIWKAMIYQIEKGIGTMASVLKGRIDGILIGGAMAHSKDLIEEINDACGWISKIYVYPGEFEMEAMAAGVVRVLSNQEEVKVYTGRKKFQGFNF